MKPAYFSNNDLCFNDYTVLTSKFPYPNKTPITRFSFNTKQAVEFFSKKSEPDIEQDNNFAAV